MTGLCTITEDNLSEIKVCLSVLDIKRDVSIDVKPFSSLLKLHNGRTSRKRFISLQQTFYYTIKCQHFWKVKN